MQNITFGRWLIEFINVYKKPFVKSIQNHKIILEHHIPEYLKKQKLANISVFEVQKALNNVKNSRTRQDVYSLYNGSLKTAFKLGLIDKDLASLIIKPKHVRQVGSALSEIELQEFLEKVNTVCCSNYYLFCLYTGARRSEALNVCWSDVDLKNNLIHIRGTKTALSDRYIPILPKLKSLLDVIPKKGNKIFHHNADFVSKTFKKICPKHKLHDLRHTFATLCLQQNIHTKVVQLWLGHSRLDTTASIYTHVTQDFAQEEMKKLKI